MSTHEPATVLVTGGTGFLGTAIVERLVRRGDEVHVLARPTSDRAELTALGVHWHDGDLTDPGSIHAAASSTATRARSSGRRAQLVHSGALISYKTRDGEAQRRVNVEGTRSVLAAARAAKVDRFLHVSSVVAVGHGRGPETLDETIEWNNGPLGVDYATTKHAAEQLVRAAASQLDVVIVNPGAIFGASGKNSNTLRSLRLVEQRKAPIAAPPGSISVLGVDDTADGCILALDRGRRGERYLLVESWMSTMELFQRMAQATGGRGPRFVVPRALWPLVVAGARLVDRIRPLELTPPQALAMLGVELRFNARKAREELGWRPKPFDTVLREVVARLREDGLLDRRDQAGDAPPQEG